MCDTTTEKVVDNVGTATVGKVESEIEEVENVTRYSDGFNIKSNSSNLSRFKLENANFDLFPGPTDRPTEVLQCIGGISVAPSREKSANVDGFLSKLAVKSVDKKVIQCQKAPEFQEYDALI